MLSVLEAFREQEKRPDAPRNPPRNLGDLLLPGTRQGGHCGAGDDLKSCGQHGQQPLVQSARSLCCSCPSLERVILPRFSGARRGLLDQREYPGPPQTFCARPALLLESCAAEQNNFGSHQPVQPGERQDLLRFYRSKSPGPHNADSSPGQSVTSRTMGGIPVEGNSWKLVASSTQCMAPTCSAVLMV